jgi:TonB family protein
MSAATTYPAVVRIVPVVTRRVLSLGIGLAASWLIFYGLSRVQYRAVSDAPPLIEDLRSVEVPMDPPPPPVAAREEPTVTTSNLIALSPERSESSVKLPDVPIMRETVPPVHGVPKIDFSPKVFKPAEINSEFQSRHIYNRREVDQPCQPLLKPRPAVSRLMLRAAKRLTVNYLCIVNRDGTVEGLRLAESSGSADLDTATAEALKEWRFSPALRRGKPVRQWVQQSFEYQLEEGSRLEVN